MATALRANFGDLLAPGLFDVIYEELNRYPDEYSKILNLKNSQRQFEESTTIAGVPVAQIKNEGASITYNVPLQGFNQRSTHVTYGGGIRISRELIDDDLYSVMSNMSKSLAVAMKQRVETTAADLFNNGFDVAFPFGDALELFSTVHTLVGGGTEQNELTNAADLSQASLEQALIDLADTTDDQGIPLMIMPKMLLVPNELRWQASVILDSQYETNSAQNDINPLANLDLTYTVNHYLTDADAWFVLSDRHYANFWWRTKPKAEADDDFDTKDVKLTLSSRFSVAPEDWRGLFGSPGAP